MSAPFGGLRTVGAALERPASRTARSFSLFDHWPSSALRPTVFGVPPDALSNRDRDEAAARIDVLLVCSAGGHLLQLSLLADSWRGRPCAWVTLDREDSRSLLAGQAVYYGHWPTTRHVPNLLRNLGLAWRLVRSLRPPVIMTTGAGIAVPFAWVGRLLGARVVYIESLTRVDKPSLSCRLIRPVADRIYVQWPELRRELPEAQYVGNVLGVSS
jgi:UDP-N-acetylglucosamine:LPS N-acetylglucosamine transferase